jgi:hypothetical protein
MLRVFARGDHETRVTTGSVHDVRMRFADGDGRLRRGP